MGSMYVAVLFIGVTNGTAVQPVVSVERFVSYRERAAGMYSALPFAFAQVHAFHLSVCTQKLTSYIFLNYFILLSAGCYRVPLCFCPDSNLLLHLLLHGYIPVDFPQVCVVLVLHVLHYDVLHILWDDDHCCDSEPSCRCDNCCSILHDLESLQWVYDSLQGKLQGHILLIVLFVAFIAVPKK